MEWRIEKLFIKISWKWEGFALKDQQWISLRVIVPSMLMVLEIMSLWIMSQIWRWKPVWWNLQRRRPWRRGLLINHFLSLIEWWPAVRILQPVLRRRWGNHSFLDPCHKSRSQLRWVHSSWLLFNVLFWQLCCSECDLMIEFLVIRCMSESENTICLQIFLDSVINLTCVI